MQSDLSMKLPDINWTAWGTIATLIASGVALGVAAGPPLWRRWWRRPKLEVVIEAEPPWMRNPIYQEKLTKSVFLRAEVRNRGRGEARNVLAVVQDWYERLDSVGWTRRDVDPSALHWVSLPWARRKHAQEDTPEVRETPPVVNVPRRLNDFVDLVSYAWDTGVHSLELDDNRPRGFTRNLCMDKGEFVLTVVIVADNAKSLTRHIHYELSREHPHFTHVQLQPGTPSHPQPGSSRLDEGRLVPCQDGSGEQAGSEHQA